MKTRKQLFDYFDQLGIKHTTYEHEPVFTAQAANEVAQSIAGCHVRNLFLKDDHEQLWLLVVMLMRPKIDLKAVSKTLKTRNLRFAQEQMLMEHIGVTPGSVTPFGLINDQERRVKVVIDHHILESNLVNAHPLENSATTSINTADFMKFLSHLGYLVTPFDFDQLSLI